MRILLDTQMLLWAATDKLPQRAADYIENQQNTLLFSSASIWEVVIKSGLGRADFKVDPSALHSGLLSAGYQEIPVTGLHTLAIPTLPRLHKDPFDRILLAQSICEGVPFLTSDELISKYPGSVIFVPR